jgi:hypothetical protein
MANKLDKTRTYIAWGFAALAAIPVVVCLLAMLLCGIVALICFAPALLIAPNQELTFGYKSKKHTVEVEKGPWLS